MKTTSVLTLCWFLFAVSLPEVVLSGSYTQSERDEAYRIAKQRIERAKGAAKLSLSDLGALDRLPPEIEDMDLRALYLGNENEKTGHGGTQVRDISLLRNMRRLQVLHLEDTPVSSLAALREKELLQELNISGTRVSSLNPLRDNRRLEVLKLANTNVSSLEPLESLRKLRTLDIKHTRVDDLSPLRDMRNLDLLILSHTPVSDLSPIDGLDIRTIWLNGSRVVDLAPLTDMEDLDLLAAGELPRLDVESLKQMTQLSSLQIHGNPVEDLDFLEGYTLVTLNASDTRVHDLSQLPHMKNFYGIQLDGTRVTDLGPLRKFQNLSVVSINNTGVNDISPLAKLPKLSRLEIENTKVTDLAPLRDMVGLEVIGGELPGGYEHPQQDLICAAHRAGMVGDVRKQLLEKTGGLEEYYRVISRIECGEMRHSPLYILIKENWISRDVDILLDDLPKLDEDLRLALLNRKDHRRLPLGRKQPETLLDRVEALQEIDMDARLAREMERLRERLVELGALRSEDLH